MAAAEARAVWQRTANRCFVQEDAKRAPKLACQSSSSSISRQIDHEPTNIGGIKDHPPLGFRTINRSSSFSNLPSDFRWWLQLQPNCQKSLTYEQLKAIESEMEVLKGGISNPSSEVSDNSTLLDENNNSESYQSAEKFDKYSSDLEFSWIGVHKSEPWWRTTDKDELASLVAQKSVNYVENCDLPPPQKIQPKSKMSSFPESFDPLEKFPLSFDCKCVNHDISAMIVHTQNCHGYGKICRPERNSADERHSDTPLRDSNSKDNNKGTQQDSDSDLSKSQLLEALRHSQTRAREAEKVAKQACAEKEHILKLVFRQASQMFAYKQWLHLLQLETLYKQIKDKDPQLSTLFPLALPRISYKGQKSRKSKNKSGKGKSQKDDKDEYNNLSKCALAVALGLSLVGAGLLLGWTVGWMLPFY